MNTRFSNISKKIPSNSKTFSEFQKNPPVFFNLPSQDCTEIEKFARANRKWKQILILGIGGSSLPPRTLISALAKKDSPEFYFLDNLDGDKAARIFERLDWKNTLVIVIAKSGNTLETLANFFVVRKFLGKNWRQQIVAITDPERGFLRGLAKQEKFVTFEVPREIGGRFSIFSNVGFLPAALAKVNLRKLLKGAAAANAGKAFEFAGIQAAEFRRGKNISAFCIYSNTLEFLAKWWEQLLAESIGKNSRVGITPTIAIGATAQHSLLQLWMDGPNDKFFIFTRVKNSATDFKIPNPSSEFQFLRGKSFTKILAAEFAATVKSLAEKKYALATFEIPQIDEFEIGKLLQFWMLEVYFLGKILKVNPFNQPGIERGKILARKILEKEN